MGYRREEPKGPPGSPITSGDRRLTVGLPSGCRREVPKGTPRGSPNGCQNRNISRTLRDAFPETLLGRPRELKDIRKGPKREPKWIPKSDQNCQIWTGSYMTYLPNINREIRQIWILIYVPFVQNMDRHICHVCQILISKYDKYCSIPRQDNIRDYQESVRKEGLIGSIEFTKGLQRQ